MFDRATGGLVDSRQAGQTVVAIQPDGDYFYVEGATIVRADGTKYDTELACDSEIARFEAAVSPDGGIVAAVSTAPCSGGIRVNLISTEDGTLKSFELPLGREIPDVPAGRRFVAVVDIAIDHRGRVFVLHGYQKNRLTPVDVVNAEGGEVSRYSVPMFLIGGAVAGASLVAVDAMGESVHWFDTSDLGVSR